MDKPSLPKEDEKAEQDVLAALRNQGVKISSWKWEYIKQLEEWQLAVFTPLKNANKADADRRCADALRKADIKPNLRRRVFLRPDK